MRLTTSDAVRGLHVAGGQGNVRGHVRQHGTPQNQGGEGGETVRPASFVHVAVLTRVHGQAHCSWCYEFTTHFFIKDKDHWLCDACKGRTAEAPRCSDAMARLETSNKRNAVCAKTLPNWEEILEKKKKAFCKQWNVTKIRYELTRESPTRHQAAKEGLVRPFLYLASMSAPHRALLAIQLGWCPFVEESFGDAHEEAWQILAKKHLGLRARCVKGLSKINPFSSQHDWVGILNHLADAHFVPSYMSWNDEFACEKMSKSEGAEESQHVYSRKVDVFEVEFMDKISKQQRSRMNRVQVCTVAQLMTTDNLRKLMAMQQARGELFIHVHVHMHAHMHIHLQARLYSYAYTYTYSGTDILIIRVYVYIFGHRYTYHTRIRIHIHVFMCSIFSTRMHIT
jgi:hypothetical protein